MKLVGVIFAPMLVTMLSSPASNAATCESLSSLSLPNNTITMAQTVPTKALCLPTPLPAAGPRGALTFVSATGVPEFCRVSAVIKPSKGSDSKFGCLWPTGTACLFLTAAQVTVVLAFYSPTVNPRTREQIFPGMVPGSEVGWSSDGGRMYADPSDITKTLVTAYLRYAVFQDPRWDHTTFDFDSGMALADRIDDGVTSATDPNVRDFYRRGEKPLQCHGWSDPSISPLSSINYYNSVLDFRGGPASVRHSYRLFMAPGMDHCGGGDGPNACDSIQVIREWVEAEKAPEQIVAMRIRDGKTERTRPLCPYPQVATYKGTGSADYGANFSCSAPQ